MYTCPWRSLRSLNRLPRFHRPFTVVLVIPQHLSTHLVPLIAHIFPEKKNPNSIVSTKYRSFLISWLHFTFYVRQQMLLLLQAAFVGEAMRTSVVELSVVERRLTIVYFYKIVCSMQSCPKF